MKHKVKVISIEPTNSEGKTVALATIEIPNVAKIFGIKVIKGDVSLYCSPPTFPYFQDGIRKWTMAVVFERKLWKDLEERILKLYKEKYQGE